MDEGFGGMKIELWKIVKRGEENYCLLNKVLKKVSNNMVIIGKRN